ncbi:class I SAM-dependent methyltransferase [Actinophytocola sp.]|uniref:class I SAM-dependent methyltransferase n=1 Tax=Actinophytocola sp. TaxID=1872138 RepID=UPI002ED2AC44
MCRLRPGATVVEIGSHQGRSTIILGHAARTVGARVVAIDAFVDGRLFGGSSTRDRFEANIRAAGLTDVVELVVGYSTRLRPSWTRPVDLLYIDGKHDYWTYVDDLRWSAHLPADGEILVHDCFSSIGVTSGTLVKVLAGRRYTYVDRSRSLARFTLRRPAFKDRWRVVAQLPWFLGNVFLKVLLRLRLRRVAGWFGHRGPYDPF